MEKKFKARKKEICFVIFWHQSGKLIITKWKIIWSILSKTSISLLQFVIQINGCAPVLALQKRFHFQWCVKGILEKIIRNLKKKINLFFFGGGGVTIKHLYLKSPRWIQTQFYVYSTAQYSFHSITIVPVTTFIFDGACVIQFSKSNATPMFIKAVLRIKSI